jgi:hypothetical protein
MTDRYIITFDDYQELVRASLEYAINPNLNMQEEVSKLAQRFLRKRVPHNARGFFVMDDRLNIKCVEFPK